MVFMKRDRLDPSGSHCSGINPRSISPAPACRLRRLLATAFCSLAFGLTARSVSAAAPLPKTVLGSGNSNSTMVLRAVEKPEAISPILGLIAAVGVTHLLHRRRTAQVRAWTSLDR
jgi:hypothetical protein